MHFIYRTGVLPVMTAIFLICCLANIKKPGAADDKLINAPELSLPISDKKLVIAHCMTNIIRYKGHKLEDSCDPEYIQLKEILQLL